MCKTVTNPKHSHIPHHEINNNNTNNLPKRHQQTVRFIADHKNGKLKQSVALAESDESVVSDYNMSLGNPQHVCMTVKLVRCYSTICTVFWFLFFLFAHDTIEPFIQGTKCFK